MGRILVIEDDLSILRGLQDNLTFEGYEVITSSNGKEGLGLALNEPFNLLILDIMLPDLSGYEICRVLKKKKSELPIIMLTARGTEIDKVMGLDYGADDYITKPFSLPELLARVRAVLRRSGRAVKNIDTYTFANITIDFKKFEATRDDEEIKLSSREFEIMKYFIEHEGEVIHRHDLLDHVWGYDIMPTTRTVDNHILELRKKLEQDPGNPRHILSIRGAGYKFTE